MNKSKITTKVSGKKGEAAAAKFLEMRGVHILEYNFRSHCGEIDIIAKDGECLVFCEVKYRKSKVSGCPEAAVDYRKQKKISLVSDYYRLVKGIGEDCFIRYDVVAIDNDEIRWYRNAFEYVR